MLTTFLNTLRTQLRLPGMLVWVFAFPVILCTIFLFMFSGLSTDGVPDPVPVAVVAATLPAETASGFRPGEALVVNVVHVRGEQGASRHSVFNVSTRRADAACPSYKTPIL